MTNKPVARSFWNWGVLIGLVFAWNALAFILYEHILSDPSSFWSDTRSQMSPVLAGLLTFPAVIAVPAYVLVKGEKRRSWLAVLPFVCIGTAMVALTIQFLIGGFTQLQTKLAFVFYVGVGISGPWLLAYSVTLGLCAAATRGIRWWCGGRSV